jgi:precorrin-8X/cobalt-precorrin-8 methylmutase
VNLDYLRDGREITRRSFAAIRAEAELASLPADLEPVAVRMIHACGMIDLVADIRASAAAATAGRAALARGAKILVDGRMVEAGIDKTRLAPQGRILCTLDAPEARSLAARSGTTRSAASLELWGPELGGAVVAIGIAPTALFRLLEILALGAPRPALVIGVPVGFVGAAESKAALAAQELVPFVTVLGRRGGSAIAAAAVNALLPAAGEGA